MEHQGLAEESNDLQSSYTIISFEGINLPPQYKSLIFSKWLRSLKYGNDYFRLINNDSYYSAYQKYIHNLLISPKALVKLAVLTDDRDVVLGFSLSRGPVLDYVHVQKDTRHLGIGTALLPKEFKYFTHITKIGISIWDKYPDVIFDPFI